MSPMTLGVAVGREGSVGIGMLKSRLFGDGVTAGADTGASIGAGIGAGTGAGTGA